MGKFENDIRQIRSEISGHGSLVKFLELEVKLNSEKLARTTQSVQEDYMLKGKILAQQFIIGVLTANNISDSV
jgi:hypothetical protein